MYCTKQYDLEESRPIFNNPVPNFYKRNVLFFPLENRNVPIFLGFETQNSGQFRLNRDDLNPQLSVMKVNGLGLLLFSPRSTDFSQHITAFFHLQNHFHSIFIH